MNNAHGISDGQVDTSNLIAPSLDAGDAVVFHPLLVHGSGENSDGAIRWTMVARYNPLRCIPYLEGENSTLYIEQQEI
jgi:ectoine hydroxylase-related dioxygenase (phytanoyl-CoA dioxygenase family)